LLVYGENLGKYKASLNDYPGVKLLDQKRMTSSNYLFLSLKIEKEAKPGNIDLTFEDENGKTHTYTYSLLAREKGRKEIKGFDSSDAIYLITPDRFVNGNMDNDNIKGFGDPMDRSDWGGRHGGDIEGIQKGLDYIKDLGFTAIWMNPVLENKMPKNSYHGYATTDYYKVDPRFGTNEMFKTQCKDAAKQDIKVIMDMIANHCGLEHWWMKDLPTEDWINQWPEYTGTNHRKTVILDPYASKKDTKQFFDGWFVEAMPDLNQRNPSMAKYLIQNSIWWIEYSGISGIRMDTYPYPDMHFMSDWTKAIMTEYPNFNIVGEEWVHRPTIVSYWQKGKQNANGYESHLKSLMDFPLHHALITSLKKEKTWTSSWTELYEELGQDYLYPDPNNLVVFPDNHDMSRIYSQLNEDYDHFKLALTYIATVRGIPQIYYGTEILMKNRGSDDHGLIRSDFPGGWIGDKVNGFTGVGLSEKEKEAKKFVQKLFNWRKNAKVIHNGGLLHFAPDDRSEVYVMFRYDDTDTIMVILNKNTKDVVLNLDQYQEILDPTFSGKDIISGTEFQNSKEILVKGKGAMIIEIE
jgi:glycosidase